MQDTLQPALVHLQARRFIPAEAEARAFLGRHPDDLDAALVHGFALGALDAPDEAAAALHRVAQARPEAAHPGHALRGLLESLGRFDAISPQYRACLALAPADESLRLGLADRLIEDADPEGALEVLGPLLCRGGADRLAVRVAAGLAEADCGRFAAAIGHFSAAAWLDPQCAEAWANLGIVLKVEGEFDAAIDAADRAVALRPQERQFRVNRAIARLRAGRLAEAWDDYDARLGMPGRALLPPERLLNDPEQLPALAGRTLLVFHEEGFGDTLQFIRYAPLLAERGVRVLAWMPETLAALVSRVPGVAEAVVSNTVPAHDLHCSVCDLPRIFRTALDTIPAPVPYLRPDPQAVAAWAARLPPRDGRRRVGLAWAGQARPWVPRFFVLENRRSMALAQMAKLAAVPDVEFFSLQTGPAAAQAAEPPPGMAVRSVLPPAASFDDTAALIANLDAVVTVDTAVVHLAGGMGVPTLLLDRYDSCWRWFAGRTDSPWYPSLRIVRQDTPGDWPGVLARVAALLLSGWPVRK